MTYTKYGTLTDEELMLVVANNDAASDLEVELAVRLELALNEVETMRERFHEKLVGFQERRCAVTFASGEEG